MCEILRDNQYIVDYLRGDVNGDGTLDDIYLVGGKPSGTDSPFVDKIEIIIRDGATNRYTRIKIKENSGYNPTLYLGDFTGNRVDDILVSIDSGGSGAIGYYYIYSFDDNKVEELFDFQSFNERYKYEVKYKDNYKVEIISKTLRKKYLIDISNKGKDYLNEIYNKNGKLKSPISGFVNPISGLFPIDIQRNGIFGLYIMQQIAGQHNADGLGFVESFMEWDGSKFIPMTQMVSVYGNDISNSK